MCIVLMDGSVYYFQYSFTKKEHENILKMVFEEMKFLWKKIYDNHDFRKAKAREETEG